MRWRAGRIPFSTTAASYRRSSGSRRTTPCTRCGRPRAGPGASARRSPCRSSSWPTGTPSRPTPSCWWRRSFHESRLIRKADVAASLRHRTYGASRLRLWWLSVPMRVVSSCRPREVVVAMLPFALVEGPLRARCMMVNLSPGCGRCHLSAVLVGTSSRRSRPRVGISHILRSPPAARSPRSSGAACYAASAARAWRNGS